MTRMRQIRQWQMLALGLAVGLAIGGVLTAGVVLGRIGTAPSAALPRLGDLQLKALASHGSDSFAIATGIVDEDSEGLFTLDYLTGDLQCFVITRNLQVGGWFKTNVAKELPPEGSKKPNYLIATGKINIQGAYGNQRPAGSVCFVVDANTGNVAAYSFPWDKSRSAAGAAQAKEMVSVAKWKSRSVNLRE
jgi:hypothetical protein